MSESAFFYLTTSLNYIKEEAESSPTEAAGRNADSRLYEREREYRAEEIFRKSTIPLNYIKENAKILPLP